MRLWTFQSKRSVQELQQNGILIAQWERHAADSAWRKAYYWMTQEMLRHGIDCGKYAPIWAWHSCHRFGGCPTLGDARALLSDLDLEEGIQTIELECPDEIALCSDYKAWNQVLDMFLDGDAPAAISPKDITALYTYSQNSIQIYDAVQATLPYLQLDWVDDIRPLNLAIGDYETYDEWGLV